jgi:CDP-2,3-bis-(O-geranylgeranyl)-sn-glycerol synthase
MAVFGAFAVAVWAMLPAYVPNNAAVLAGGGPPVDGGRTWRGRRLLGDGKTWRGTVAGVASGVVLAVALDAVRDPVAEAVGVALPGFPPAVALALPAGAMLGDLLASLLKRRLDRQRGAPVPGLDQLDFVVVALAAVALAAPTWTRETFLAGSLPPLVVVLVLTPALHLGTNVLAYGLSLKSEPY